MKHLTIFCSTDLDDRVVSALDEAGAAKFLRTDATGNRFLPPGEIPRTVTWEASMYVVTLLTDAQIEQIRAKLADYVGACDIEPCLELLVGSGPETI